MDEINALIHGEEGNGMWGDDGTGAALLMELRLRIAQAVASASGGEMPAHLVSRSLRATVPDWEVRLSNVQGLRSGRKKGKKGSRLLAFIAGTPEWFVLDMS
eukprot:gene2064-8578_t